LFLERAKGFEFSNISINKLEVLSAGNDCLDVSGGSYSIIEALLSQCKDKGLSVGEGSILNANLVSISNSLIGISAKDSSFVNVTDFKSSSITLCAEVKQKKQEFGGANLTIRKNNCLGDLQIDKNSIYKGKYK